MKSLLITTAAFVMWLFSSSAQACAIWSADGQSCLAESDSIYESKSFAIEAAVEAKAEPLVSMPDDSVQQSSTLSQYQAAGFPEGVVREEFRRLSDEEFRALNMANEQNETGVCASYDDSNKSCSAYYLSVSQYERAVSAGFQAAAADLEVIRNINLRFGMLTQ